MKNNNVSSNEGLDSLDSWPLKKYMVFIRSLSLKCFILFWAWCKRLSQQSQWEELIREAVSTRCCWRKQHHQRTPWRSKLCTASLVPLPSGQLIPNPQGVKMSTDEGFSIDWASPAIGVPHGHFHQVWLPSAVTAREDVSPRWVMRRWGLQFLSYASTHFWWQRQWWSEEGDYH